MQIFRLTELELESGHREIQVDGELDLAVADQLEAAIGRAEGERILISLEACEFIDSTGIAVIVHAHRRAIAEGRNVVTHSPNDQVRRVLSITGLVGNGLVFENREAAASVEVLESS